MQINASSASRKNQKTCQQQYMIALIGIGIGISIGMILVLILQQIISFIMAIRKHQMGYVSIPCNEPTEPVIEPLVVLHFRNSVCAVIHLASVSPETRDLFLARKNNGKRTIKKVSSVRKLKSSVHSIGKKASKASLKDASSSSSMKKKSISSFIDKNFCLVEQTHEWVLSKLGRVKFTDHAPMVFQFIRDRLGYTSQDIFDSLDRPLQVLNSEGKSEAIFFCSQDKKILFKTLRGSELNNLKAFLHEYASYVSTNIDTLLPRFLGLYTFECVHRSSDVQNSPNTSSLSLLDMMIPSRFTVVAMANVFDSPLQVNMRFDFKGSQLGRESLDPQLPISVQIPIDSPFNITPITLKEMDFQKLIMSGTLNRLHLDATMKRKFLNQLLKDVSILRNRGFIDYSLLIGIYRHPRNKGVSGIKTPSQRSLSSTTQGSPSSSTSTQSVIGSPHDLMKSAIQMAMNWVTPQEPSPSLVDSQNATQEELLENAVFVDIPNEKEWQSLPFHKSFQGGIRSVNLKHPDIDYEVYFIGLIDILQRYNMVKWIEREIKRQQSKVFGRESTRSLSNLFNYSSQEKLNAMPSPSMSPHSPMINHQPCPAHYRDSTLSSSSVYSDYGSSSQMGEPSVEEPLRYGSRLMDFVETILI